LIDLHDVVVVAVARTPFGRFEGALRSLEAPRLGAATIDEVLNRAEALRDAVDVVYGGVGMLGAGVLTPVRQAVLLSRLPEQTVSLAVDRACCSGMTAIALGMKDVRLGLARAALCGGFESLSRTPVLWPRQKPRIGDVTSTDPLLMRGMTVAQPIPVYSGEEALKHGVDRVEQDEWALSSHQRYFVAQEAGYFGFERFTIEGKDPKGSAITLAADESPRLDASLAKLARLAPVYGGRTVTAGNAPGLSDGAAFLLLTSGGHARELGVAPLARLLGHAQVCGGPTSGTSTPALAIAEACRLHGIEYGSLDLIEINEAYAATPLVSTLVLAGGDRAQAQALRGRTNVHGGAVAIGHPLGASGARIVMTLINGLRRRGGGRGVAAICGGFGQGDALLVEVP
jgi:acetyl-CoA C-acetyltransferase